MNRQGPRGAQVRNIGSRATDNEHFYRAKTSGILVEVRPQFIGVEEMSHGRVYVYHYAVSITNYTEKPCQVLRRHWIIRNGFGEEEHIRGDGVVGQQPIIQPQRQYCYTSGCPLPTPTGSMRGSYRICWLDSNEQADVTIPLFFLRLPTDLRGLGPTFTTDPSPSPTRH